jgi:DNA repair exonuclease SbcCD nuclease subunit
MPYRAIITDTHFGARNDSVHMQQNMKRFLDDVFFPTLDEYNVDTVWHGGDYVDRRKYVNFSTARFIYESYRTPLNRRNITEIAIVGNHDTFYRETNDINSLQELYRTEDRLHAVSSPVELDDVLFLPWICDGNRDVSMRMIQDTKCPVVLGHLEIAGFQMYRGMPSPDGLNADIFDRFELVMSGHYHHRSSKGPIQYLGAPWPMIWSDYRDPRGFHLFNTDTRELRFIENPYSLFARIVYDDTGQTHDYIKHLVQSISAPNSPYHSAYVKVVVKSKENPFWFDLDDGCAQ